ncbi:hypothetical protein KVR01_000240 [Diaporthe batatas]|uniref:uncharacterized protein n=1 Tax=Diaporthe batatas TaxID=748121 RepID=UPI001D054EAB|nr:uncharacterized protein KVR01_000240 [Diaporthe batatas]KAG8169495.1 hypothetical protein KVR01_000240 [Diaporthe batatas]
MALDIRIVTQYIGLRNIIVTLGPLYLTYWFCVFVYRITLHPLAKFPGPKLAGATFWYEFYYDVWPTRYRYMWKIEELHRKYGPIVRINPRHIHIRDPDFLDPIYAPQGRQKRNTDPWFSIATESGMMGWSLLQTTEHQLHHVRRASLSRFFSKSAVRQLEGLVTDKIDRLVDRFAKTYRDAADPGRGVKMNLTHAIAALTMDIISSYALGGDMGNLSREEWGQDWFETFRKLGMSRPLGRQFRTFMLLSLELEPWFVRWFNPRAAAVAERAKYPMKTIQEHITAHEQDKSTEKSEGTKKMSSNNRTIFMEILDSSLPPKEKSVGRLNAEAFLVLGAGTDPTTRNLTVTLYFLLSDRKLLERVREELMTMMPRPDCPVTVAGLEALPLFSACIQEGLRLTNAVSTRSPRIAPDHEILYKNWVIPRGTPIMQSLYLLHMDPDVFPDPTKYNPQRWLEDTTLKSRYMMAFGRGSRMCLGMNLAYAELFMTIARLITRFDMEPFDVVKERDVDVDGDCFNGITRDDSPGIQVTIFKDSLLG